MVNWLKLYGQQLLSFLSWVGQSWSQWCSPYLWQYNIIRSVIEKEEQERELKRDFPQVKKLHFI